MRIFALVVIAVLAQDPPKQDGLTVVQNATTKLMEKKTYAFTLKLKVDGDAYLQQVLDKMDQDATGIFQKESILHVKSEDVECVKNGGDALFLYQKKWRTREETAKLFKNKLDSPTRNFDTMDNPHDEIGSVREKVAALEEKGTEALGATDCVKYAGALTDEGAQTLAKIYFGRMRVKGGKGQARGNAEPAGGKGTATIWISKDGLPVQLQYDLSFVVVIGKSDYKTTIVRTVSLADFDTAKLDIPADVLKRLKIE
jgi:hypothetical protein